MINLTTVQQLAIATLTEIGQPAGILQVMQVGRNFGSKEQLKEVLGQLVRLGKVHKNSNGQYRLPKVTVKKPTRKAAPKAVKSKAPAIEKPKQEVAALANSPEQPVTESVKPDPLAAIDSLAKRLSLDVPQLDEAELKIAVLERLGELLEPSIADVLNSIQSDLIGMRQAQEAA